MIVQCSQYRWDQVARNNKLETSIQNLPRNILLPVVEYPIPQYQLLSLGPKCLEAAAALVKKLLRNTSCCLPIDKQFEI